MKALASIAVLALGFATHGAQAACAPHELTAPTLRFEFLDSAFEMAKQQF
jgi:hypothetical protein